MKIDKLKSAFKEIGCDFITTRTLIGDTISVFDETKEIMFEFDYDGNFNRIITSDK